MGSRMLTIMTILILQVQCGGTQQLIAIWQEAENGRNCMNNDIDFDRYMEQHDQYLQSEPKPSDWDERADLAEED